MSKSRPAVMNISSFIAISSSIAWSPVASKSPGMPIALGKSDSRMSIEPSSFDATSTSQVRLKKYAYLGGLMEKQRGNLSQQEESGTTWNNHLHISPDTSHYVEAVFMVRKIYGKQPGGLMEDLYVNLANWRLFMNTTLQAAVHLGKDYDTNLHYAKNHIWDSLEQLFGEIKRLICEQSEILGPKTPEIVGLKIIEFEGTTWRSISLLCERACQITTSKVYVFSDSVLCMGEMRSDPNEAWMKKTKWYSQNKYLKELSRIDGMQTEFEWKIFPGFTTYGILEEIHKFMKSIQCEPEHFNGRIIFMSMFDDIVWKGNSFPTYATLATRDSHSLRRRRQHLAHSSSQPNNTRGSWLLDIVSHRNVKFIYTHFSVQQNEGFDVFT